MDIRALLRGTEGKTLEFKRDLSSPRNIVRTVVAFANSAGGSLVIGVEDGSRTVVGVTDALDQEERLASILSDSISPRLVPDIEIVAWRNLQMLAVSIYPGPSRPYRVSAEGADGVYVRVGSTNRRADAALAAELGRSARGEGFDEQPFPEATADGIDLASAAQDFEGIRRIGKRDLETLRLLVRHQGHLVPSAGGVLLYGSDRSDHFPDAGFRAARFKGTDRTSIIDTKDFSAAPLPVQVELVMEFVQRHVVERLAIDGVRNESWWEYPLVAVREAVTNAAVHADYSQSGSPLRLSIFDDRIEIENPGLLVPGLAVPDLFTGVSRLRNRVIGRVFRELRMIEQWGSGIQRMVRACREAGLPEPRFEEVGTHFRVTLYSGRADAKPVLDEVDERLIEALRADDGLATSELAELVDRTPRAVRTRLARLVELGLVVELGSGPTDPHRRYYAAEERGRYGRSDSP
jgi:predicted HTH transcriptional regulator